MSGKLGLGRLNWNPRDCWYNSTKLLEDQHFATLSYSISYGETVTLAIASLTTGQNPQLTAPPDDLPEPNPRVVMPSTNCMFEAVICTMAELALRYRVARNNSRPMGSVWAELDTEVSGSFRKMIRADRRGFAPLELPTDRTCSDALLSGTDWSFRYRAMEGLEAFGRDAKLSLPDLIGLLRRNESDDRYLCRLRVSLQTSMDLRRAKLRLCLPKRYRTTGQGLGWKLQMRFLQEEPRSHIPVLVASGPDPSLL